MRAPLLAAAVATVALGAAGYALSGRPDLPARPAPVAPPDATVQPAAEQASQALMENFGDVRAWITLTDALMRAGRTETAVHALESGLEALPDSPDLWVQMGIALVAHANGEVVPAARLAFDRASRLAPDHPAPAYFLGLAWLQSGEPQRAIETWASLLERSTEDAPWRPMIQRQMDVARMMARMGVGRDGVPPLQP